MTEHTFEGIVAQAVGEALDRRWRQMVATALTVATGASLIVNLPLTLLENSATDRAARIRSSHNCQIVRRVAAVMGAGNNTDLQMRLPDGKLVPGGFLSTDAALRQSQQFDSRRIATLQAGPLKTLLEDPQVTALSKRSNQLDSATSAYWQEVLIPALLDAASADCSVS